MTITILSTIASRTDLAKIMVLPACLVMLESKLSIQQLNEEKLMIFQYSIINKRTKNSFSKYFPVTCFKLYFYCINWSFMKDILENIASCITDICLCSIHWTVCWKYDCKFCSRYRTMVKRFTITTTPIGRRFWSFTDHKSTHSWTNWVRRLTSFWPLLSRLVRPKPLLPGGVLWSWLLTSWWVWVFGFWILNNFVTILLCTC